MQTNNATNKPTINKNNQNKADENSIYQTQNNKHKQTIKHKINVNKH